MTNLNINLDLGVKRITINNDPNKVIEFSPENTLFIEKFYTVYSQVMEKQDEYLKRYEELEGEPDENGIPKNVEAQIALVNETTEFMRDRIDFLLGEGTSNKVFGDVYNLSAISQFLEGLGQFVKSDRAAKVKKFAGKRAGTESNVME